MGKNVKKAAFVVGITSILLVGITAYAEQYANYNSADDFVDDAKYNLLCPLTHPWAFGDAVIQNSRLRRLVVQTDSSGNKFYEANIEVRAYYPNKQFEYIFFGVKANNSFNNLLYISQGINKLNGVVCKAPPEPVDPDPGYGEYGDEHYGNEFKF